MKIVNHVIKPGVDFFFFFLQRLVSFHIRQNQGNNQYMLSTSVLDCAFVLCLWQCFSLLCGIVFKSLVLRSNDYILYSQRL